MRTTFLKTSLVTLIGLSLSYLSARADQLSLCFDFNNNLVPAGTEVSGAASVGGTNGPPNGVLHLTDAGQAAVCGGFNITDPLGGGIPGPTFIARWRSYIGDGENGGADGYSLNWGTDVPTSGCSGSEEGSGTGLSVVVDTFDNGAPLDPWGDNVGGGPEGGIEIHWRGSIVAYQLISKDDPGTGVFLRKSAFVDSEVRVNADGTATFSYDGNVITATLAGWTPIGGGNFSFAARTGGANDNQWIDDLCLITEFTPGNVSFARQPADATVFEGETATFYAVADGTPTFSMQWQQSTDGGATFTDIPGATAGSYTTPPAGSADDGKKFRLVARNASSSANSQAATLHVQTNPRLAGISTFGVNEVHFSYTKSVDLGSGIYLFDGGLFEAVRQYGATHAEVVVVVDPNLVPDINYTVEIHDVTGEGTGLPIIPNPTTRQFTIGLGRFCADFNDGQVPAGTIASGTTAPYVGPEGALHLTDLGVGNNQNFLTIPLPGVRTFQSLFIAQWKTLLGGLGQADGFSFNVGQGPFAYVNGVAEEGATSGLSVTVDTFDNGAAFEGGDGIGPEIRWNGTRLAMTPAAAAGQHGPASLMKGQFVDATVVVSAGGLVTFTYDTFVTTAQIPSYTGLTADRYEFGARTGGAAENCWIDDVKINCYLPGPVFFVQDPADATALEGGSATFTVAVDGTPLYSFQWQQSTDGGATFADIPGATAASYTTPPTSAADEGKKFRAVARNEFGPTTSGVATLHVQLNPRVVSVTSFCGNSQVLIRFTRAVDINTGFYSFDAGVFEATRMYGANHKEVIVVTDLELVPGTTYTLTVQDVVSEGVPLDLLPNPTTTTFHHGFDRFCADFNNGQLPAGTIASGITAPYVGPEGALHLTDRVNGQVNYWSIPLPGVESFQFFRAQWRTFIEGVGGADGVSFNAGVNVGTGFTPEEGAPSGLSVQVDTFNNGSADTGVEVKWNGTRIGFLPVGPGVASSGAPAELALARFVDTSVDVSPSGFVTFKYDTYVVTGQIPNYSGINVNQYVFAARTGGANENAWIDDVCINPWSVGPATIVQEPADASIPECTGKATFRVLVDGAPPYDVQWYANGVLVASVSGSLSTTHSFTTPAVDQSANGTRYKAVVSNSCGSATTREAVLTVIANPPLVLSATAACRTVVVVDFNQPLDAATAQNAANYSINGGSAVTAASLEAGRRVYLTVSPLPLLDCLKLTVSGVKDACLFHEVSTTVPILQKGPILASGANNLIVVEAEDADYNRSPGVPGAGNNTTGNRWVFANSLAGYVGSGYADCVPNIGGFSGNLPAEGILNAPRLDFCVNVPVSGTYYIWARGSTANDGGNNSYHMAVDGVSADDRARRIGNRINNWGGDAGNVNAFGWVNDAQAAPAAIDLTAGLHTINVLMREDGLRLDRFLLTTDAAFTLAAAAPGPAASPRAAILPDTQGPMMNCPANVVAECNGGLTPVTYAASAVDLCSGPVPVTCVPPSGSNFPLGPTTVHCTANDSLGNQSSCSFTVTVMDTVPPQVTCPADISVKTTNPGGTVVNYVASANDTCGIASFNCSPPPGSTFTVGQTTVTCTAVDGAGHPNACSFKVTVTLNRPPVCVTGLFPQACGVRFANDPNVYAIALNDTDACVILDGSQSSDPDNDPLTFGWLLDNVFPISMTPAQEPGGGGTGSGSGTITLSGNTLSIALSFSGLTAPATAAHIHGPAPLGVNAAVIIPLNGITTLGVTAGTMNGIVTLTSQQLQWLNDGLLYINIHSAFRPGGEIRGQLNPPTLSGATATNCFSLGCHSVTLSVSDGQSVSRCDLNVCVITACEAVEQCVLLVENSDLGRKNKRPLIATLKAACASFDRGNFTSGMNQLQAFQNKVRAQITRENPAAAQAFIDCVQRILDAIDCAAEVGSIDISNPPVIEDGN